MPRNKLEDILAKRSIRDVNKNYNTFRNTS